MQLKSLSLRARSALIALLAMVVFTPFAILAIDSAYGASLKEATFKQLKLTALMLISELEFVDDAPAMPSRVYDEKLNINGSGVYGFIRWHEQRIWQSSSSEKMPAKPLPPPPPTGQETFVETDRFFIYAYTAEFETSSGYSPVHFFTVFDQVSFNSARKTFLTTLWWWMGLLNGGLLVCLILAQRFLLRPLSELRSEIEKTASGKQVFINQDYPEEIKPLSTSINQLIDTEKQQRERYKHSLSDLAHSLKTPLTVALGESSHNTAIEQPLLEIKAIINRQLKRAAATSTSWQGSIHIAPVVHKLVGAMQKVHADKALLWSITIPDSLTLAVEQTDLMECLGNVLDNGCKAANSQISVSATINSDSMEIAIDDDGPGVKKDVLDLLLTRGQRLDTYEEGQGIGLALVVDIVSSYGGQFTINTSSLGGASAVLSFPHSPH